MLTSGILNPHLLSLLSRVRHTNTLVIADRGFPSWPGLETVDISLTEDIPRVQDVLRALKPVWRFSNVWMAEEFQQMSGEGDRGVLYSVVPQGSIHWEPHSAFKLRVPHATGLIRTGDCTPYANIILESC